MMKKMRELYWYLIQAAIFSDMGISTRELLALTGVSRTTLIKRLNEIADRGMLTTNRNGKEKYYQIDLIALESLRDF